MLREEVVRQEGLVARSREHAAGRALVSTQQVNDLMRQLESSLADNRRLKDELGEARENFARLGAQARETEERLNGEMARLNGVVARLEDDAHLERRALIARAVPVRGAVLAGARGAVRG